MAGEKLKLTQDDLIKNGEEFYLLSFIYNNLSCFINTEAATTIIAKRATYMLSVM